MIRNILKRDLKRKKTMNIIILMFVMLAAMFVSSSVGNIVMVMNGTGYYFEQAGLGDYAILTMGERAGEGLEEALSGIPEVTDYRIEEMYFASQNVFTSGGEKLTCENVALLQCLEDAKLKFFDKDNQVVTSVEPGFVYCTSDFMKRNGLKVGDEVTIHHNSVNVTLTIAGRLKDALLGSAFVGNSRFLMSREDYNRFSADETIANYYHGYACYIDTTDTKAVTSNIENVKGIAFNGDAAMLKMCYAMDMIIAAVLLVVSICLIIVSFVVLKFTITFTLQEEFREIGVMKAIGITNKKIRRIYLVKYLAIAIAGALLGFIGSIPFANMLMKSVSENMVLDSDNALVMNVIGTVVVVLIIVAYAYRCTGKLKKYSPIDAIRSGQTGERFRKKARYHLGKSSRKPSGYMAINDVVSSPRRYLTIVLAFTICALLVFIIVNTTETMRSDRLAYTFGKVCDAYYTDSNSSMEIMHGDGHAAADEKLDELEKLLHENGMDADVSIEVWFMYPLHFDGEDYKLTFQQGINTRTDDYVYYKGSAPENIHEIAITDVMASKIGVVIGDTVQITIGDKTEDYTIVALFQSMNKMGEIIRIHEDVATDMRDCGGVMSYQIDFKDHPSKAEINRRVARMKDLFGTDTVFNAAEYSADCIGVVDVMDSVGLLLLGITIVVIILVTILMERSFISDEKSQIAILKAIGFTDRAVIAWHVKRLMLVGTIAILLAIGLAIPVTKLSITPIFAMMGLKHMSFEINPIKVFLMYPGILLSVTFLTTYCTALYTKTIKASDTAGVE